MYWAFYHEYPQEHATVRQRQISSISAGRPPSITSSMLDGLLHRLTEKPCLYVEEMMIFLWNEFDVLPSPSSIKRALSREGWTKKKAQQKAKEQDPHLQDFHQHKLSEFHSCQLIFVDEPGCDKQIGYRRTGWSPLGMTPVQLSKFHRGERYQILPAYAQDDIIFYSQNLSPPAWCPTVSSFDNWRMMQVRKML